MTTVESKTVSIEAPAEKLFNYLSNFNNFQHLMPPQVTQWKSTTDSCSFNIQGMADIELNIQEKIPFQLIKMNASGTTPVGLFMTWNFIENRNLTDVRLVLDADLNPVMAMMAKAPLNNFVNLLVDKLKELAEKGNIL